MDTSPVLAIDTSYDPVSQWFATGRGDVYEELGGQLVIARMGRVTAERTRVLRALQRADDEQKPFRAVVVSSHGGPSQVFDDDSPDGILLDDKVPTEELRCWGRGRVLYFCSCETGRGPLLEKLMECGAVAVIGYTERPSWTSDEGRRLWRDLDIAIVKSILYRQPPAAVRERVVPHYLERIEATLPFAGGEYTHDMIAMTNTLRTIRVLS
jgi:hypothetical protein